MYSSPAILRKRDNSYSKDLCRKTLRNGIELCQDRYLSMRRLSNLSPLRNFFLVDLFSRRRGLMNITCTVAGKLDSIT